jgi:hypothetical protein
LKLLYALGARWLPQGVSNTKEYKHKYIILGSIIPGIRIIKNIAASTALYLRLTEDSASAPKYVGVI